jgi:hypothetical protein
MAEDCTVFKGTNWKNDFFWKYWEIVDFFFLRCTDVLYCTVHRKLPSSDFAPRKFSFIVNEMKGSFFPRSGIFGTVKEIVVNLSEVLWSHCPKSQQKFHVTTGHADGRENTLQICKKHETFPVWIGNCSSILLPVQNKFMNNFTFVSCYYGETLIMNSFLSYQETFPGTTGNFTKSKICWYC